MELSCRRSASWRTRSSSPGVLRNRGAGKLTARETSRRRQPPHFSGIRKSPGLASGGPDGPDPKTHTTRDIVVFSVLRGAAYGRLMRVLPRFHGSCATRCHVVPPSASYGRLMPRSAGFCHVFGGAFTVRLAALSMSSQSRPASRPPSRDSHARGAGYHGDRSHDRRARVDGPQRTEHHLAAKGAGGPSLASSSTTPRAAARSHRQRDAGRHVPRSPARDPEPQREDQTLDVGTKEERESTQRGLAANGSENPL